MQINACIKLKYIESVTWSLLRIDKLYIVFPAVFLFHGIDCCKVSTPVFLVEDNWQIPFKSFIGKFYLNFPYMLYMIWTPIYLVILCCLPLLVDVTTNKVIWIISYSCCYKHINYSVLLHINLWTHLYALTLCFHPESFLLVQKFAIIYYLLL